MYGVIRTCRNHNLVIDCKIDLFDKTIKPISYGCEVRGFHKTKLLEKLHISFCKHILILRALLFMENCDDIPSQLMSRSE